jgi:hypothetical protein
MMGLWVSKSGEINLPKFNVEFAQEVVGDVLNYLTSNGWRFEEFPLYSTYIYDS